MKIMKKNKMVGVVPAIRYTKYLEGQNQKNE